MRRMMMIRTSIDKIVRNNGISDVFSLLSENTIAEDEHIPLEDTR